MIAAAETDAALMVLVFAGVLVVALLAKAALQRIGLPPLVAYLALGIGLGLLDERLGLLGAEGRGVFQFFATLGVVALLFRVGLESDLPGLIHQLRSAAPIWVGNVLVSGAAGYVAARYLLSMELIPSLVIATAMTATSVGIPARVWQQAHALDTDSGRRFVDVGEMDDISGVVLMGLLFSLLPVLRSPDGDGLLPVLGREAGLYAVKLVLFSAGCVLFSRYVERRYTGMIRRIETGPDPMLVVVGTGMLVAAVAGLLGFSVAIGAFFAGLVFSRDPKRVKVDAKFAPLYDLLTPFFFVGVGLRLDADLTLGAAAVGGVLVATAVAGKLVGTIGPARLYTGWLPAVTLGVSMVPRAEITLLILHRASGLGEEVVPSSAYAGMVLVSAVTCLAAPPLLLRLIRRTEG